MHFGKSLLIGFFSLFAHATIAQNYAQECEKLQLLASEAIKIEDFKTAVLYLHKAEKSCGSLDKDNWDRLIGCLQAVVFNDLKNDTLKLHYIDSLLSAYDHQEEAGFYEEMSDLKRATFIIQSKEPDVIKADFYFQRGIKSQGIKVHESYIVYAYYATYLLFTSAEGEEKSALKTRMISDYLRYSKLVDSASMSLFTKEQLTVYFEYVVESCDDLLPSVQLFLDSLPEEKTEALTLIQGLVELIENKHCQTSTEYEYVVDEWLRLDSSSIEASYRKRIIIKKGDPIKFLPDLIEKTDDPEIKAKLLYQKAYLQFKAGQYSAAYISGKECTGEYKGKGLLLAAQCVAALANSCGDNTFERKCNYIYAAQLAEEAGKDEVAARYRSSGPSSSDCINDDRIPITLDCWEITVYICR